MSTSIPELENIVRRTQNELASLEAARAETAAKPLPKVSKDAMLKAQDSAIALKKEELLKYQAQLEAEKQKAAAVVAAKEEKKQADQEFNELVKTIAAEPQQPQAKNTTSTNTDTNTEPEAKKTDKTPFIVGGIILFVIIVGVVIYVFRRKQPKVTTK